MCITVSITNFVRMYTLKHNVCIGAGILHYFKLHFLVSCGHCPMIILSISLQLQTVQFTGSRPTQEVCSLASGSEVSMQ